MNFPNPDSFLLAFYVIISNFIILLFYNYHFMAKVSRVVCLYYLEVTLIILYLVRKLKIIFPSWRVNLDINTFHPQRKLVPGTSFGEKYQPLQYYYLVFISECWSWNSIIDNWWSKVYKGYIVSVANRFAPIQVVQIFLDQIWSILLSDILLE